MAWWLEKTWCLKSRMIGRLDALAIDVEANSPAATALMALVASSTKKQLLKDRCRILDRLASFDDTATISELLRFLDSPLAADASETPEPRVAFAFEEALARGALGFDVQILPSDGSSSRTDGRTIWLGEYPRAEGTPDQAPNLCVLLHELGHLSFGSLEPVPSRLLSPLEIEIPPRDLLSLGEVFQLYPRLKLWFVLLEECRVNELVGKELGQYSATLTKTWIRGLLEKPLPRPRALPSFFETIEALGYPFLGALGACVDQTSAAIVFSRIKRSMRREIRGGRGFTRDELLRRIIRAITRMPDDQCVGAEVPVPTVGETLQKAQTLRIFASSSESSEGDIDLVEAIEGDIDQPQMRKEEKPIFSAEDRAVSVEEWIEGERRLCEIKDEIWAPFLSPIRPATVHRQSLKRKNSPIRRRLQPSSTELHHALVRVTSGLSARPNNLQRARPATQKIPATCVIDLSTSMCAERAGLNTPIEVAIGLAGMLFDAGFLDRAYGSIDAGRRKVHLFRSDDPRALHEIGAGGLRTGPLIRYFGRSRERQKLVIFSDTAFGQYVSEGLESNFGEIWEEHCASCTKRRSCCIDPAAVTERRASSTGHIYWYDNHSVELDLADALEKHPKIDALFVVLEPKTSDTVASCAKLQRMYGNVRFEFIEKHACLEDLANAIVDFLM